MPELRANSSLNGPQTVVSSVIVEAQSPPVARDDDDRLSLITRAFLAFFSGCLIIGGAIAMGYSIKAHLYGNVIGAGIVMMIGGIVLCKGYRG